MLRNAARWIPLCGFLLAAVMACGVPVEYAKAWEGIHSATFLPGYSDYRGEVDGTDDGYVVMSYLIAPDAATTSALEQIAGLVKQRDSCYRVSERTNVLLVLRCPGGRLRGGYRWDEEYRFLLAPKARRIYVQVLDSVKRARYSEFARTLDAFKEN